MAKQVIALRDMGEYIRSDCFRYTGGCSAGSLVKCYLTNKTFRWQVAFRLCHGAGPVKYLGYLLWLVNQTRHDIQISIHVSCGYGLYIGHAGPIAVNRTAVLGHNCSLSQFTTIGSNHDNAAVIGDNVYIGPNVCLVENVHIGDNSVIGAGSVVTKDIPANCTAAGNYAKVLHYDKPNTDMLNPWPVKDS